MDIREWYDKGGSLAPGKRGISLTKDQFEKLVGMTEQIRGALKQL